MIVELMTCTCTAENVFPFMVERCKEAGLKPVVALKESTGFIFNRIWAAIKREVLSVISEGVATPATVDGIWREMYSGNRSGPWSVTFVCRFLDSLLTFTTAR